MRVGPQWANRYRLASHRGDEQANRLHLRRSAVVGLSGLVEWIDVPRMVGLSDGDAVGAIPDFSPVGNSAHWPDSAQWPLYKTAVVNSLPVLRFDGSNDILRGGNHDLPTGSETYFVCTVEVIRAQSSPHWKIGSNSADESVFLGQNSANELAHSIWGSAGATYVASDNADLTDVPILVVHRHDGSNVYLDIANDSGSEASAAASLNLNYDGNSGGAYIGAREDGQGHAQIDLCERIIVTPQPDSASRDAVISYLTAKWGL